MSTLLIAIGNTLRRDDGVAHRVLEVLGPLPDDVTVRALMQLTPEISEEISHFGRILIVDAEAAQTPTAPGELPGSPASAALSPAIKPIVREASYNAALCHSMGAAEIVALSRSLYAFDGEAHLCHIPVPDFSEGEGVSPDGEANAQEAAALIRDFLHRHA